MKIREKIKKYLLIPLAGLIFTTSITSTLIQNTYAVDQDQNPTVQTTQTTTQQTTETQNQNQTTETQDQNKTQQTSDAQATATENNTTGATCSSQIGTLGWLLCPAMSLIAKGIDAIYGFIETYLVIKPISTDTTSPVFQIWAIMRNLANIVFIIFLLVVIFSQLTGFGINNYGIKKALPRLIIAAILINLSYIICAIGVDASNIIGSSLYTILNNISNNAITSGFFNSNVQLSVSDVFFGIAGTGAGIFLATSLAGGPLGLLLAFLPVLLGGIIAVFIAFVMVSLRQAVVILLVAISPIAFVLYMLPNTEKWFKKWYNIFFQMLFFYPMFAMLFGASRLASYVLLSSATDALGVIIGFAVQILPLFFAINLMKMSGTVLGGIGGFLAGLSTKATGKVRGLTDARRDLLKTQSTNKALQARYFNPINPSAWRALGVKQRTKVAFMQEQANITQKGLLTENLAAQRVGDRIIGYDKDNQPIYKRYTANANNNKRRTTTIMDVEAEAAEVAFRSKTANARADRIHGGFHDYLEESGVTEGRALRRSSRMGDHFYESYLEAQAKENDDRADRKYLVDRLVKASERDSVTGKLINPEEYNELVSKSIGSAGYRVNLKSVEGREAADQAKYNVLGDIYGASEALHADNIKRFETYMRNQTSAEVDRAFADMVKFKNIDGIIAGNNVMAQRGDYDKITKNLTQYLNDGNIELATDASQRIALNLLAMKNSDPALGRLGKFINMETWAYTSGERKEAKVTMDQYITGVVEGEERKTKINLASALNGTSLQGIDRTAMNSINILLERADSKAGDLGVDAAKIRDEVTNAMMPALIKAMPGFDSGSEQITSTAGFITGMKFKAGEGWVDATGGNDAKRNMALHATSKYLGSLTARNVLDLKSDTWAAITARYRSEAERQGITDAAEQEAYAEAKVRRDLAYQLDKATDTNWNLDQMKAPIRKALHIDEMREAKRRLAVENQKLRKEGKPEKKFDARQFILDLERHNSMNLDSEYDKAGLSWHDQGREDDFIGFDDEDSDDSES